MKRALELYCHDVTVRFMERAVVPPYEGSMIRGAFGRAFKESCCPFPHDGKGCPLGDNCPYGYVFEPPEETKMEYEPGERMRFGFTVVGRAAEYMPYFIYAFSKMGDEGVGRRRARYKLERVVAKNPLVGTREEIFDGEVVKNRRLAIIWENAVSAAQKLSGERARFEFLTPTFVKFKGEVSPDVPPFAALVQALLIRIPMLSAVHCGEVWRGDFKALVEHAGEVKTVRDETTWVSYRRYSSFKNKSEPLEGLIGQAEYAGPIEEFLPLLEMGQLTHVGKRTVFGLGRYRLC